MEQLWFQSEELKVLKGRISCSGPTRLVPMLCKGVQTSKFSRRALVAVLMPIYTRTITFFQQLLLHEK